MKTTESALDTRSKFSQKHSPTFAFMILHGDLTVTFASLQASPLCVNGIYRRFKNIKQGQKENKRPT